jgi:hypothetical protein
MYTTRTDVSPLQPTMTFHHTFGSPFVVRRPVTAVRSMVTATGPTHHFSLVKWETKITVYDEDTRHVVRELKWDAWDTAGAMRWFHSMHGTVQQGREVVVTFKGRWA